MSTKTSKSPRKRASQLAQGLTDEMLQLDFDLMDSEEGEEYLFECEAAEVLGLEPGEMRTLRKRGDGPAYYDYPVRGIRYRLSDLLAYKECKRRGLEWKLALRVTLAKDPVLTELPQQEGLLRSVVEDVVKEMLLGGGGKGRKG
jgi:hypothetical protein